VIKIGARCEKVLKRPLDILDTGHGNPGARVSLSIRRCFGSLEGFTLKRSNGWF
jgi:hypothetical protein